jgi:hypothetical protein
MTSGPSELALGLRQVRYILRSVANGDDQSAVAGRAAEIVESAIAALSPDESENTGSVHDGPVAESDAPKPSRQSEGA